MSHTLKHPAVLRDSCNVSASVPDWNEIPPAPKPPAVDSSVLLAVGRVLWLPLAILIYTLLILARHP